ncbi:hydrogen gas-evolving membrane-bound hydrogenase subunit E [Streptoalloteichus hindustanus]|uniref:Multicomponent Na+:H+ antiporter subunit A n=1 Tax=Streptoalloteichus hindustanus TaxID=2017 RepID=A0A1M5P6L6_STRHI|nr:hydrogen gas-evolving membrane-bound hydrogenase subunit E [Streptoalloteichus hindustanus]SHG97398.1 multicomponent Na+:H+ antiporter subunit A [Streptoalloteichus hindustanus]
MLILVIAHLVVAALVPPAARRWGPRALLAFAALPTAALAWTLTRAPGVLAGEAVRETVKWAGTLDLSFAFRLDPLALLVLLLVTGVGAAVLVHGAYYLDDADAGRVGALLLVFAGAMVGLVTADHLITLYVFWELTTVCSFLLIGGVGATRAERKAALQALLVTALGGLLMLLGLVMLGEAAGTYRLSAILSAPPRGGLVEAALALVLVGAFTKSAQLPFHPWLPAAMVAPTPVSAYLHAAAMVKAGVYLVARWTPAFADVPFWRPAVLVVGLLTLLVGAWRALAETDLKRLLAFGTVSELGLLMVLFGAGTPVAASAGAAMLLAHGAFKAALFLLTGVLDHQLGTRDARELSGVARTFPGLAAVAVLAAASMAGLPPLVGFLGKEASYEAFAGDPVVLAPLVLGSVLTVAYSVRFLWGGFATKPGVKASAGQRPTIGFVLPPAVLAAAGLLLGLWPGLTDDLARGYANGYGPTQEYHLAMWHGFTAPLLFSAVALVAGVGVGWAWDRLAALRARLPRAPEAQRGYEYGVRGLDALALQLTRRTQVGSLPLYLTVILLVVLAGPGLLLALHAPTSVPATMNGLVVQVPLGVLVLAAAIAVPRARHRLSAVLLTGVVGYGVAGLFVAHGAPDLALTQFLVETLVLVVFALVLRRMPVRFTPLRRGWRLHWPRWLAAGGVGLMVGAFALRAAAARDQPAISHAYLDHAEQAGAHNVVSAVLVDFRALDTLGEIGVLAVAAVGVASLVVGARRPRRGQEQEREREREREEVPR